MWNAISLVKDLNSCRHVHYLYIIYLHIYVYISIYIYIYFNTHPYMYISIYTHTYTYMNIYIYIYIYKHVYINVCIYILWRGKLTKIPKWDFIFARVKTGQVGTWSPTEISPVQSSFLRQIRTGILRKGII